MTKPHTTLNSETLFQKARHLPTLASPLGCFQYQVSPVPSNIINLSTGTLRMCLFLFITCTACMPMMLKPKVARNLNSLDSHLWRQSLVLILDPEYCGCHMAQADGIQEQVTRTKQRWLTRKEQRQSHKIGVINPISSPQTWGNSQSRDIMFSVFYLFEG